MACSIGHLIKVASESKGRQVGDATVYRWAVPSQYIYHGPQVVTLVQQPDTGVYHQIPITTNYARWYVCQLSQLSSS
ncbi:hypothetical protein ES288_D09G278500v1 [Gossypium darwinii]|uniref:Uncharacterized protein n=1 Tax=Gossypium darwinii TaxID=34276 RepID=A0A5D2BHC7_GOSDA|nr:hypothetical protein ES288_D09G278500v1 [Gossypium darwinii]